MRVLLEAGANREAQDGTRSTPLLLAVWREETTNCMLEYEVNVEATKVTGLQPIHIAVRELPVAIVQQLIDRGAKLPARDNAGDTALHWAADGTKIDNIRYIFETGFDTNTRANDGRTALHQAARHGTHVKTHRALLEGGVDPNARDKNGKTAIMTCMEWNSNEPYTNKVATLHLAFGLDTAVQDSKRKTAI